MEILLVWLYQILHRFTWDASLQVTLNNEIVHDSGFIVGSEKFTPFPRYGVPLTFAGALLFIAGVTDYNIQVNGTLFRFE